MKDGSSEKVTFRILSALNGSVVPFRPDPKDQEEDSRTANKFAIVRYVELKEIHEYVGRVWCSASEKDVLDSLKTLEDKALLRRVSREKWKVLLERKIPKQLPQYNTPYRSWKEYRKQAKHSGICPGCGQPVTYKNRHARSGTDHTGEQCSLNKIKSVMGE